MKLFFDTSALVKFFHLESGTERVVEWINEPGNTVHVSELTRLEFMSALYRRYRNREIGQQGLADALNGFDQELQRFKVEPLGSVVLREAERLLRELGGETGLRTLDAMHLATFLLVKEEDWFFVASDQVLLKVARELGIHVLNPVQENL